MIGLRTVAVSTLTGLLLVGGWGCSSDNDRDRDRVVRRSRVDRDTDRLDRDRRVSSIDDRDSDLRNIPRNAVRVDTARGSHEMEFEARRSGMVYVYDVDADRVVYSGRMRDGDRFLLDADDNMATLNGKKVLDADLKSQHVFRLYYSESRD